MNTEDRVWFSKNFQSFFKNGIWAEIWVNKWTHARRIFKTFKGFILLVDPWGKQDDWDSDINDRDYSLAYNRCLANTKNRKRLIARWKSSEIAPIINDNHLDWVYIDAQHSYDGCLEDIELWFPKVRKWWLVSWHDYYTAKKWSLIWDTKKRYVEDFWVEQAVNDFCKKHGYKVNVTDKDYTWWFIK